MLEVEQCSSEIRLLKMKDNHHGDLPFFTRKYNSMDITNELHRHEYIQINYIYSGRGKHILDKTEFDIIRGDIFVIPPYVPHRIIAAEASDIEIIELEFNQELTIQEISYMENTFSFFDFLFIEPYLVSNEKIKPRLNLAGKDRLIVQNILLEIIDEFNTKACGFETLIKSQILNLLIKVGRAYSTSISSNIADNAFDRHRNSIKMAIEFIEQNYTENISIEDVAKISMLSTSYFSYMFKNITSRTFVEYVNDLRISKSMETLRRSNIKVGDICFEVGFNNISHFNRLFKQYVGVSPTAFRKTQKRAGDIIKDDLKIL